MLYSNVDYVKTLRSKLAELYKTMQEQQPTLEKRAELNGYIEAALRLNAVSNEELEGLINVQHQKAFGKSIKQRRLDLYNPDDKDFSWEYFDKPAWERE